MTTQPWPEDDKPVTFEEIVEPLYKAVADAAELQQKHIFADVSYDGFDIGDDTAAHSPRADELLKSENLDPKPLRNVLRLAVQVGIEQGRRLTLSSGCMPAVEVVDALTNYLESMDMSVAPEKLMRLLTSAARHLLTATDEPFKPEIMPKTPIEFVDPPLPAPDETMAERAKRRPENYRELSPQEQWQIDRELGILDWDGSPEH